MWIMEGKPTKNPNRKLVQKAPLRMLLIFPDPWGNGRSLCPVTLLLVWMTSSDATVFPRCVAFFRKIFLKRKLRILSTFFSVNLEVCYRSRLFFAKEFHCALKWRRKWCCFVMLVYRTSVMNNFVFKKNLKQWFHSMQSILRYPQKTKPNILLPSP